MSLASTYITRVYVPAGGKGRVAGAGSNADGQSEGRQLILGDSGVLERKRVPDVGW